MCSSDLRRPLNAHPDFYAVWADGKTREASESNLFFATRKSDRVFKLPEKMTTDDAKPEELK